MGDRQCKARVAWPSLRCPRVDARAVEIDRLADIAHGPGIRDEGAFRAFFYPAAFDSHQQHHRPHPQFSPRVSGGCPTNPSCSLVRAVAKFNHEAVRQLASATDEVAGNIRHPQRVAHEQQPDRIDEARSDLGQLAVP